MKIEVRCLDDKICEDCPYLKIEMKYGFKDTGDLCDIFYECGHLGMCEELREMFRENEQNDKGIQTEEKK